MEIPETAFRDVSSIDLLASEHAVPGRSGRRVVVFLRHVVDRVELVLDDRIEGIGLDGWLRRPPRTSAHPPARPPPRPWKTGAGRGPSACASRVDPRDEGVAGRAR